MSVLTLDSVRFGYRSNRLVLRDVSLEMSAGQSALVLGDNGSGKSTLGRLIGALATPTSGRVAIDGTPLPATPSRARTSQTVYVSQVSYLQFFRATLSEEIALAASQSDRTAPTAEELMPYALPDLATNPRDLTYPEMWRFQLLLFGAVFRPAVLYIDEIVAPGSAPQQEALRHTLDARRLAGHITLLAYQRAINLRLDRTFAVEGGTVSEVETPSG